MRVTRNASAAAELELLFHAIGSIISHLNLVTSNQPMNHTDYQVKSGLNSACSNARGIHLDRPNKVSERLQSLRDRDHIQLFLTEASH